MKREYAYMLGIVAAAAVVYFVFIRRRSNSGARQDTSKNNALKSPTSGGLSSSDAALATGIIGGITGALSKILGGGDSKSQPKSGSGASLGGGGGGGSGFGGGGGGGGGSSSGFTKESDGDWLVNGGTTITQTEDPTFTEISGNDVPGVDAGYGSDGSSAPRDDSGDALQEGSTLDYGGDDSESSDYQEISADDVPGVDGSDDGDYWQGGSELDQ